LGVTCIAKIEALRIELKIGSNFGGCIAKIETLRVKLKINSNLGGNVYFSLKETSD
jgi:ArsR family metal-binding transcriptional regulator